MAPPPPRAVVAIPPFLPGSLTRTTASGEDGGGRKDRASSPRHDRPSARRVKFADHVLVGAPSSPSRPIFPSGEEDDDADRRRRMGDRTRAADAEDALASSTGTMTTTTTTIPPPTQPRQQQQQQQHQQPWRSRSIVAPPSHSSRPPSSSSFYSSTTSSHTSPTSSRDHIHQQQQHHQPKQRQQLDGVLRSKNARRILGILSLLVATRLSSYLGSSSSSGENDDRVMLAPPLGIMEGAHPSWSGGRAGVGRGNASSSSAAVDWSKVSPHLHGYYSKIYGADGGGGGGGSSPSAAAARREAGRQPTVHQQQQQHGQELLRQHQQQKANEMTDDGSPILPEKVPTLDVVEFKRQQQALERNAGTVGGVRGWTTSAAAAAGGVSKEQPPAAPAAGRAAEEKEKEAAVVQARAAHDAPPPPPPPPPPAMEMPSEEEMAMSLRLSEERVADAERLPNKLEEEGRKRQESALENASIGGGSPAKPP